MSVYGEWCPKCSAEIVSVTRGIPSMGTCKNGHTTDRRDTLRREPAPRTDLAQASVAAALEAAANAAWLAGPSQDLAQEELSDIGKERRDMAMRCEKAIRALITPAQHDALAAHVAAEVAKARAEDAVKVALHADVLEFALKIGRAEWGQTDPKTAAEHAADMALTVEKTAAYFGQTEPQSLNGLYIEGTDIVICHTGVSPNSPEIARILTGLWNMIYDTAQIGAKP